MTLNFYACDSAPLLGPAIGPIIGGALTQAFNWRASFWFLLIFTSLCFVAFIFFKDTFRRERSLTYQLVLKQVLQHREEQAEAARRKSETSSFSQTSTIIADAGIKVERVSIPNFKEKVSGIEVVRRSIDTEVQEKDPLKDIGLTLKDVNPFPTILTLLARPNNLTILFASGRCFLFSITFQNRFSYYEVGPSPKTGLDYALTYSISYTCSRTLSNDYHYDSLQVGLVLLTFGVGASRRIIKTQSNNMTLSFSIGSICGSILGGRWSDFVFRRLKAKSHGEGSPEVCVYPIPAVLFTRFFITRCGYKVLKFACYFSQQASSPTGG